MNSDSLAAGNVFLDNEIAKAALKRLKSFGITNIRWDLLEIYGQAKLESDLTAAMGAPCRVRVCYDSHTPMDLIKYVYCGSDTYTVRIPIMPTVIIESIRKKK